MNGNLTPEKRMDSTGKLVTRHVKTVSSGRAFQAPPLPSVPGARECLIGDALETFKSEGINVNVYADMFAEYDDSTLHMIVENVADSGTPIWSGELFALVSSGRIEERDIREYITYAPTVDDEDVGGTLSYIRGLRQMDELKSHEDFAVGSEDLKESIRTLLRLSVWAEHDEDESRYSLGNSIGTVAFDDGREEGFPCLYGEGLIKLVIENPRRGDDIIKFIQQRGYSGPDEVLAYLESGVPSSLIEGVL